MECAKPKRLTDRVERKGMTRKAWKEMVSEWAEIRYEVKCYNTSLFKLNRNNLYVILIDKYLIWGL